MKELSIEEKAKAYDEAKARMSRAFNSNRCTIGFMNEIFPELKESEDERIRKSLIAIITDFENLYLQENYSLSKEEALAWLEKQGDPKEINPSEFDLRLNILLKHFEPLPKEEIASVLSFYLNVVQNNGTYKEEKQGEQKPAEWSEEDENILNTIINHFKIDIECTDEDDTVRWLKSLKDRYTWRPSEMQMTALRRMKNAVGGEGEIYEPLNSLYEDLKKLKD